MRRKLSTLVACVLLLCCLPTVPAFAQVPPAVCEDGLQDSGAVYRICMPGSGRWNGSLMLYAHGYVDAFEPIAIPEDQLWLPDDTYLPDLITGLGFAFALSSYSTNGLAFQEGVADTLDLIDLFTEKVGPPEQIYVGGPSEGGLVTALSVEQHADVYDGGFSVCGPVGSFRGQINFMGDVRALFDYFFPGVIPGSAVDVPQEVVDNWFTVYEPAIVAALDADQQATTEFLNVTRLPTDPDDGTSAQQTILDVIWYNAFGAADAGAKLGGVPYGNLLRPYFGSENDLQLNRDIERYQADPVALEEIAAHYETTGQLDIPLITLHTTGDPVVPYWHQVLYRAKIAKAGSADMHINIPVQRYGHCAVEVPEVLAGFALMIWKASGQQLDGVDKVLADASAHEAFAQIMQEAGAPF